MRRRVTDIEPPRERPFIAWRDDGPTTARWFDGAGLFVRADVPDEFYQTVVGFDEWEPIGSLEEMV